MNYAQAIEHLELMDGVDESFITLAFEHKAAEINARIEKAPTDGLKEKYQQQLAKLEHACFVAMMGENSSVDEVDHSSKIAAEANRPESPTVDNTQVPPKPENKPLHAQPSSADLTDNVSVNKQQASEDRKTSSNSWLKAVGVLLVLMVVGITSNVGGSRIVVTKFIVDILTPSELELSAIALQEEVLALQSTLNQRKQALTLNIPTAKENELVEAQKAKAQQRKADQASRFAEQIIFSADKQNAVNQEFKQVELNLADNEFQLASITLEKLKATLTHQLQQIDALPSMVSSQNKADALYQQWQVTASKAGIIENPQAKMLKSNMETANKHRDVGEFTQANSTYLSLVDDLQQEIYWSETVITNTIQAYSTYRNNHSNSPYLTNADQRSFNIAKVVNKVVAYQQYLNLWPSGTHRDDAEREIKQLKHHNQQLEIAQAKVKVQARLKARVKADNAAFYLAKQQNTEKAYLKYLATYAKGRHNKEAKKLAGDAAFATAKKKNNVDAYQEFIIKHPDNEHIAEAMYTTGNLYKDFNNKIYDIKQSLYWLNQSADLGYTLAMTEIAFVYDSNLFKMNDDFVALKWYRKAAKLGEGLAMRRLGTLHLILDGVTKEEEEKWANEAIKVFTTKANKGDVSNMVNLAGLYFRGYGDLQMDVEKALYWYERAANKGSIRAMYQLAIKYHYGQLDFDYQKARDWYLKAATLGHINSMYGLSLVYANKKSGVFDNEKSKAWYKKAVELGYQTRPSK